MNRSVECRRCHLYIPEECNSCPHCSTLNSTSAVGLKYRFVKQVKEGAANLVVVFQIGIALSLIVLIYYASKYF